MKKPVTKKNLITDSRTADGFVNFVAKVGSTASNQFSQGHYSPGKLISRNRQELEWMYRTSWTTGKVIDIIAEDMTRGGIEITSEIDPGDIAQLMRAFGKFKIWHQLSNALKWSRLYGGGLAIMLIDGQDTKQPLDVSTIKQGQFKGLMVLDRWLVNPSLGDLISDMGPNLGYPKYYDIIGDAASLPNFKIHHSRIIRFDGVEMPYYQKKFENMWGISVIERMYDMLVAFDSVIYGAAQLVFKAHLRGIGVKGLREALSMGGKAEEAVIKQFQYIQQFQTNEGLTLLDSEDEFWTQQYGFAGISDMIVQMEQQMSGAADIPLVRFFGMSPAGLNSTGTADLQNHYDHINELQEFSLRPEMETKLFPVLFASVLGQPMPEDFVFDFNSLWEMSDNEKAEIASKDTATVSTAYNAGLVSDQTALKELKQSGKTTGLWTNITDEDIEKADSEVQPKGEFGMPGMEGFGEEQPEEKDNVVPIKKVAAKDSDFVESEHPREEDGKFTEGAGSGSGKGERVYNEGDPIMETGEQVTFTYSHNNEKSASMGNRFAQNIEPKGEYITYHNTAWGTDQKNVEYGTISFKNPLVLEHKTTAEGGWKTDLSNMYGGKKGLALTKAVLKDGYDGIITVEDFKHKGKTTKITSEIVNLEGEKTNLESKKSTKDKIKEWFRGDWV